MADESELRRGVSAREWAFLEVEVGDIYVFSQFSFNYLRFLNLGESSLELILKWRNTQALPNLEIYLMVSLGSTIHLSDPYQIPGKGKILDFDVTDCIWRVGDQDLR